MAEKRLKKPPDVRVPLASRDSLRRETFIYRPDLDSTDASPSKPRPLTAPAESAEALVTPFAQLLQSLRNVRNNFVVLNDIPASRSRHSVSATIKEGVSLGAPPQIVLPAPKGKERQKMAAETLEELEWCLDQLEIIQKHRAVGDMTSFKFKRMLNRELTHFAGSSSSGKNVSEYITQTFLDNDTSEAEQSDSQAESTDELHPVSSAPRTPLALYAAAHKFATSAAKHADEKAASDELPISENISKYGVEPANEKLLAKHLEKISVWGVNMFEINQASKNRPLTCVTYTILQQNDLANSLKISVRTLLNYLTRLEEHYRATNPYHNNVHAADVTQTSHVLLSLPTLQNVFSDLELFATIFASAIHDVDHPGLNNQFLVNSGSDLALLYNDESVLENHHVAVAFKLLQKEGCDILQNFHVKKRQNIRRMVISMVLATDMCKHMDHVAHLRTRVEMRNLSSPTQDNKLVLESYSDRIQLLQNVVHCADLSNPAKPLDIYQSWTDRITEEFFRQGDRERQLGIDVSPMCDRHKVNVPKAQIAFIDYVVYPLWETWANVVYPDCQNILDTLDANRHHQKSMMDQGIQSESVSDVSGSSINLQ